MTDEGTGERAIVLDHALKGLPRQIEPVEGGVATFKLCQKSQGLGVVIKTVIGRHALLQDILARMAEGRVAEIVGERQPLGQILV